MARILLFITKKFPFGNGEEFIENEVQYLAERFDKVIITSVSVDRRASRKRAVPENFQVVRINDFSDAKLRYLTYLFRAIPRLLSLEMIRELVVHKGLLKKAAVMYSYARMKRNLKKLHKRIKTENFAHDDLLTIYSYWFIDTAHLACKLKERFQNDCLVNAVSRAHGYDLFPERNRSRIIPFRNQCMDKIDKVFPCSQNGTKYLQKEYPQYASKVVTAYLGTADRGAGRARQSNDEQFCIVTCSSIRRIKRVELVARALQRLEVEGTSNVRWFCIGNGPLLEKLKDFVSRSIHQIEVTFLGRLANSELMRFYKNTPVDVFVNVSEHEGLPVSIMEAQSFGIPAIATDVGGTSEIVVDGQTGILLPKEHTEQELSLAILKIMHLPCSEYMNLRRTVRERWELLFDAKKNYRKFAEFLISNDDVGTEIRHHQGSSTKTE